MPGLRSTPGQNLGDGWQGCWSLGEPHHTLSRLSVCSSCSDQVQSGPPAIPSSMGDPPSLPSAVPALPGVVGLCLGGSRVGTTGSGEGKAYWFKGLSNGTFLYPTGWTVGRGGGGQVGAVRILPSGLGAPHWAQGLEPSPASPVAAPPLPPSCGVAVRGQLYLPPFY